MKNMSNTGYLTRDNSVVDITGTIAHFNATEHERLTNNK